MGNMGNMDGRDERADAGWKLALPVVLTASRFLDSRRGEGLAEMLENYNTRNRSVLVFTVMT
jgi:hypothetical protein